MELIVYAPVFGQSGFEQLSRGLFLALDQMGVQIELRQAYEWNSERVSLPSNVMSRLMRMTRNKVSPIAPHVLYQLPKGQPIHKDAPTICYTLFETDRCPSPWLNALNQMDKVLVFSEFNRSSWSKTGIPESRLGVLPPAIDSFLYNPLGPKMEISNAKGFVFLTSGDFTERKNFEAIIEAYVTEFSHKDPVTLVMKCHYGGFVKRHRRDCANKIREIVRRFNPENPPRILFYGDKISNHAMAALYRSSDCFVLASRGEGLGLQYLEAMASGVPIISCDWGAQTDYLNSINSYPVMSSLGLIDDPNYIVKCPQALNSKWCQVNVEDLRRAMRHVMNNHGEAKEKAQIALNQVRQMTWQKMAIEFIKQVVNLYPEKEIIKPKEEAEMAGVQS